MKRRASGLWSNGLYSYRRTGKRLGSRAGVTNILLTVLAMERVVPHTSWSRSPCRTAPQGNMGKSSADPSGVPHFPAGCGSHESFDPIDSIGSVRPSIAPSVPHAPTGEHPAQQPQPKSIRIPILTRPIVQLSPGLGKTGRISGQLDDPLCRPFRKLRQVQRFWRSCSHFKGHLVTTIASRHLLNLLCLLTRLSRRMSRRRSQTRS